MKKIMCLVIGCMFMLFTTTITNAEIKLSEDSGRALTSTALHIWTNDQWELSSGFSVTAGATKHIKYKEVYYKAKYTNRKITGSKYRLYFDIKGDELFDIGEMEDIEYKIDGNSVKILEISDPIKYHTHFKSKEIDKSRIIIATNIDESNNLIKELSQDSKLTVYIKYKNGDRVVIEVPTEATNDWIVIDKHDFSKEAEQRVRALIKERKKKPKS